MNTNKLNFIIIPLLLSLVFFSCDDMEDIHRKYAGKEEQIYLGKVDSLRAFSGLNRVKLTWYINSDPKIKNTVIYWNLRNDSIVKPFNRVTSGIQKDSIFIENISEGAHLFECKNFNERKEYSLFSVVTGISWGKEFISNLKPRTPTMIAFDSQTFTLRFNLTPTFKDDGIVYSQINYSDKSGNAKDLRIDKATNSVKMSEFPMNGSFELRSVFFFPEQGVDSLYTDYLIFNIPN